MAKTEGKPETKDPKKAKQKAEVVQPLKVDVNFPSIMDLKQALAFDGDGNLIIAVQFKAKVDQFEVFRLVNLLKQPHGTLYAIIGSPQTAMDFKFDTKNDKVEVIKAAKQLAPGPAEPKPQEGAAGVVKIHSVAFNHIPEEEDPFGVLIEYLADGTGEVKSAAGRGKTATEAVISGVHNCGAVAAEMKEPFEIRAALELLEPSGDCYKLIRVIDVGSFDVDEGKGKEGKEESKGE